MGRGRVIPCRSRAVLAVAPEALSPRPLGTRARRRLSLPVWTQRELPGDSLTAADRPSHAVLKTVCARGFWDRATARPPASCRPCSADAPDLVLRGTDGTGDTEAAPLPGLIPSLLTAAHRPVSLVHTLVPPPPVRPGRPVPAQRQRLPAPGLLRLLLPLNPRGWFRLCYSGRCCLCYVPSPVPPVRVPSQPSPCSVPYCPVPPLRMPGQGRVRLGATCAYTSLGPGQASAAGAGGGRWPLRAPPWLGE